MLPIQVIVKYCDPSSGGEGVAFRFCEYLQRNDIPFSMVCGRKKVASTPFDEHIVSLGMLRPTRLIKYSSFFNRAANYIRSHEGLSFSFEYVVGTQILRMTSVHELFLQKSLEGMPEAARRKKQAQRKRNPYNHYLPWQEKRVITHPNLQQIITPSHMTQAEVVETYPFLQNNISVIHNGINPSRFTPPTPEEKNAARQSLLAGRKCKTVIGYAGNNFERKGLSHCIASLRTLTDAILLIAGSDTPDKYQQQARQLGVEDRTIFLGHQKDMRTFFHAIDVFCLPTRYDPFGLVFSEAIACDVPTVATTHAGGAEIIQEGISGYIVDSISDATVTEAIRKASLLSGENINSTVPTEEDMFASYLGVAQSIMP